MVKRRFVLVLAVALMMGSLYSASDKDADLFSALESNESVQEVSRLITAGADVNARDKDGSTPLMYAAQYSSDPAIIKALADAGADANARDKDGSIPLMYAAVFNTEPDVIKALLSLGTDVNAARDMR